MGETEQQIAQDVKALIQAYNVKPLRPSTDMTAIFKKALKYCYICSILYIYNGTEAVIYVYIYLDMESEMPLYQQIVNQVIEMIANGRMKPGEPLPSVRRLASDIGINLHTVNKSYKILQQQGYIRMHRRKGAVIAELYSELMYSPEDIAALKEMMRPTIAWAVLRGVSSNQLHAAITDVVESIKNAVGREEE